MAKAKQSFETMMTELEDIVAQLEQGELPLEQALKRYAAGVELAAACRERLSAAETLLERAGEGE